MDDGKVVRGNFSALGHAGSDAFVGLEVIGLEDAVALITFNSDEFTAVCPVTGQPDQYTLEISLENTQWSIESKSLKIYLNGYRNVGGFAENLVTKIKADVFDAIREKGKETGGPFFTDEQIAVSITQKRRGGIEIQAVC